MLVNNVAQNSYALLGHWRIGKTSIQRQLSLALEGSENVKYRFFPIFIDLQQLGTGGDEEFFHFIADHIVRGLEPVEFPPSVMERLRFDVSRTPFYDDRRAKMAPSAAMRPYRARHLVRDLKALARHLAKSYAPRIPSIVLQIDESSFLQTLEYDTLLGFRSIFMSDLQRVKITTVLSGKSIPPDPVGSSLSPWANFINRIEVEPLTPEEATELIVAPARDLFEFDRDVIERIIARAEGKPLVVQELCHNAVQYMYAHELSSKRITMERFEGSLEWEQDEPPAAEKERIPPAGQSGERNRHEHNDASSQEDPP
jgi:hypothetical protein